MTGVKQKDAFEDGRCPNCGLMGEWNFIVRKMECKHCNISGGGYTPFDAPREAVQKPKPRGEDTVVETFDTITPEGQTAKVIVTTHLPKTPIEDVPNLGFSVAWGLFHKHRLQGTHEQEKRWGRDHLRKLRENDYGYDPVVDANLVVKRQIKKPLPPEPTYTPDEVAEYLNDVRTFLRNRDTNGEKPTI